MSLVVRITDDMKAAMKAKDHATLSTLRFLISAVKNRQIDVQHELSDAEVQDVIKTQVKQLKDSIASFEAGGRGEMVASAQAEIEVLTRYLPEQMSDEALESLVKETIAQVGAASKADTGKVMGACVKAVAGKADGARIKDLVGRLLPVVVLMIVGLSSSAHAASIPLVSSEELVQTDSMLLTGLRLLRVLILWFGIGAITLIINGAFQYMVASFRDDEHHAAAGKITHGVFITLIVATVFAITTVYLQRLG